MLEAVLVVVLEAVLVVVLVVVLGMLGSMAAELGIVFVVGPMH